MRTYFRFRLLCAGVFATLLVFSQVAVGASGAGNSGRPDVYDLCSNADGTAKPLRRSIIEAASLVYDVGKSDFKDKAFKNHELSEEFKTKINTRVKDPVVTDGGVRIPGDAEWQKAFIIRVAYPEALLDFIQIADFGTNISTLGGAQVIKWLLKPFMSRELHHYGLGLFRTDPEAGRSTFLCMLAGTEFTNLYQLLTNANIIRDKPIANEDPFINPDLQTFFNTRTAGDKVDLVMAEGFGDLGLLFSKYIPRVLSDANGGVWNNVDVIIGGHSLGGALSLIVSACLKPELDGRSASTSTLNAITFGAPHTFSVAAAERYSSAIGLYNIAQIQTYGVDAAEDWVPGIVEPTRRQLGFKKRFAHVSSLERIYGDPSSLHPMATSYSKFMDHIFKRKRPPSPPPPSVTSSGASSSASGEKSAAGGAGALESAAIEGGQAFSMEDFVSGKKPLSAAAEGDTGAGAMPPAVPTTAGTPAAGGSGGASAAASSVTAGALAAELQIRDAKIAQLEAALAQVRAALSTAPTGRGAFLGMASSVPAIVSVPPTVPAIAVGYEAIYRRFMDGRLEYRPTPGSDAGLMTLPIRDLFAPLAGTANPLSGTFDLSGCGDGGQYISINIGYKKAQIPANADKVEIWICPKSLVERELATTASHLAPIMDKWEAPVGYLWTWGGDGITTHNYDCLLSGVCMDNGINLYEKWAAAHQPKSTCTFHDERWFARHTLLKPYRVWSESNHTRCATCGAQESKQVRRSEVYNFVI